MQHEHEAPVVGILEHPGPLVRKPRVGVRAARMLQIVVGHAATIRSSAVLRAPPWAPPRTGARHFEPAVEVVAAGCRAHVGRTPGVRGSLPQSSLGRRGSGGHQSRWVTPQWVSCAGRAREASLRRSWPALVSGSWCMRPRARASRSPWLATAGDRRVPGRFLGRPRRARRRRTGPC